MYYLTVVNAVVSESTPPLLITGNKGKEKETKKKDVKKKKPPSHFTIQVYLQRSSQELLSAVSLV